MSSTINPSTIIKNTKIKQQTMAASIFASQIYLIGVLNPKISHRCELLAVVFSNQDVNFFHVCGVVWFKIKTFSDEIEILWGMSSRFTRCYKVYTVHCREKTYVRFSCNTGGAMGINMVTKGVHNVIEFLTYDFPYMDVIGISGTGNHRWGTHQRFLLA